MPVVDDRLSDMFRGKGSDAYTRTRPIPSWEWAASAVDYSRAVNYDTPYRGRFDPDLMPFWKEPLEMARHRDVREIAVLKCSRSGFSENFVLTDGRYTIARAPEPSFYLTGAMDLALGFLERRWIRGMSLAKETAAAFKQARTIKQDIQYPTMDFRATWSTSDTATKQDGWSRIWADEVSLWKEFTVDMLRRRAAAYPFHHIIFGGSIDPSRKGNPNEDPILKLYLESDCRVWLMPDPAGGTFAWRFSGVKWPDEHKTEDGWDLEAVERDAWYETPSGTRIDEADRMEVTRAGRWEATNPGGIRVGYKVTAPMVPFEDCSFGSLAKRFLSAKHRMNVSGRREDRAHNTLRVYFAEYWAEAHQDEEESAADTTLASLEQDYAIGQVWVPRDVQSGVFVTVDVQKYHLWWLARTWAWDAEAKQSVSSLLDFGNSPGFSDLDVTIGEFKPAMVGIDIGYALRQSEVADYCAEYADADIKDSRVLALRGSDDLRKNLIDWIARDATEGRSTKGGYSPYLELTWATDPFRSWLIECLNGRHDWAIPNQWRDNRQRKTYTRQVTSTRKLDGEWVAAHADDHGFDLESMQLVLARWDGLV